MADYNNLKQAIQAVIRTNGNEEITGQVMQDTLLRTVNVLGAFALYRGVANTSTNPGTPDQRVFYFASEQGTYVNFGNFVLSGNKLAVLHNNNGTWQGDILMTLSASITPISVDNALSTVSTNPVENRAIATEIQSLWATVNSIPTTPLACKRKTIYSATELTGNTFADKIIVGFRMLVHSTETYIYTSAFQIKDGALNRLYIFGFHITSYTEYTDYISLMGPETLKAAIGVNRSLDGSIEVMYLDNASTYDLTAINAAIARFTNFLDNTDSVNPAINTWKDMENFMGGVSDTDTFLGKLAALKAELQTLINAKEDKLTFDDVPTINSDRPVKSGGVYSALQAIPTNALRQISDFSQYSGTDGEIVQYIGTTTDTYINGYTYKNVSGVWTQWDNQPAKVANGDGFLQVQNNTEIASVISIEYNSNNNHLELKGVGGAVVSYVDMDGIYDGADIVLSNNYVIANAYVSPQAGDTLDEAVAKLARGLSTKEDILTFDDEPTADSDNPVKSGGIKTAIDAIETTASGNLKQRDLTQYSGTDGEIVQHIGETTADFVNGYVYKLSAVSAETTAYSGYYTNQTWYEIPISSVADIVAANPIYRWDYIGYVDGNRMTISTVRTPQVGDTLIRLDSTYRMDVNAVVDENTIKGTNNVVANYVDLYTPLKAYRTESGLVGLLTYDDLGEPCLYIPKDDTRYEFVHVTISDTPYEYQSWTQHNVQPSSAADVSALQQRMTAAETAIQGKQATITGAATTITSSNLTASKILGSDANGKVAATSIATADAEDAVSKRHTQNTDTQIISGTNSVVVNGSGTTINGNGSVTGNLSVSGNLNVTGKQTVTEIVHVVSENDTITLRKDAQTAIASGSLSGTKVENYDGLNNNLLFGTDASGVFRIGDEGGTLEPIATRDEAANLTDGQLMKWDAANQRLVGTSDIAPQINSYVTNKAMTEDAYWDLVVAGTVLPDTLYITFDNDWEG